MKTTILLLLTSVALVMAGCASHKGHAMGCGKCGCKMMQASASDPHKCAMCGHMDSEHGATGTAKPEAGEHKH